MATYLELHALRSNSDLQDKVSVAVVKKAQAILDGAPNAASVAWAVEAIESPRQKADSLLNYILAANSSSTVGQIQGATDATIQSALDTAVDVIIGGGV